MRKKGFYWHVHHDRLMEWCYEYNERVASIKQNKQAHEVEPRLKYMQKVKGKLPDDLLKAGALYDKASVTCYAVYDKTWKARLACNKAYNKAWRVRVFCYAAYNKARKARAICEAAYSKAWTALDEVLEKHKTILEKLHAKECPDCTWNGRELVFKEKQE